MSWTDVPYDATNFSAGGPMGWTVQAADVRTYGYEMLTSSLIFVAFYITESSVYGVPQTQLKLKIPNNKKAIRYVPNHISCWTDHQEPPEPGVASTEPGSIWISLNNRGFIDGGQLWSLDANCHTWVCGQLIIPVEDV